MKVFVTTILSDFDGNLDAEVKVFDTREKASGYLYSQYIELRFYTDREYDFERVNCTDDHCEEFYIEDSIGTVRYVGLIEETELNI